MPYRLFTHAAAVTPDDNTTLVAEALYVGGTGDVAVVTAEDETVVFQSLPAGSYIWVACKKVKSTSTDATEIVALW